MYATLDDMTAQFGEDEVIALTDRSRAAVVDATVANTAIANASAEIDTYLAARYALPLNPAPLVLVRICCDMARYNLCGSMTRETEPIVERYKAATRFLQSVASGAVTIGTTSTGAVTPSDNAVVFRTGSRAFRREDR